MSQTRHWPELWQLQTAGPFSCVFLRVAFIGGHSLWSDQMSAPSPLLGPQSDWCVWFYVPLPGARVALEWCWLLSGLLAHRHTCGLGLDGLPPRVCWWGRSCNVHRGGASASARFEGRCSCAREPAAMTRTDRGIGGGGFVRNGAQRVCKVCSFLLGEDPCLAGTQAGRAAGSRSLEHGGMGWGSMYVS